MKRLLGLVMALLLGLSAVCSAAAEGVTFSTPYFAMTLPEGWEVVTDDLESEDGAQELGYFCEPEEIGIVAAAYLVYYEDLKNLALWSSDEDELQAYAEAVMEEFEDMDAVYLGTVMAGNIPFVLIKGTDENDEFLYADTITNGYAIQFEVFVTDSDTELFYPFTDEQIALFESILATFRPVDNT